MLDESEWTEIEPSLRHSLTEMKQYRATHDLSFEAAKELIFSDALNLYYRLTGFRETNIYAILHHRQSLFGAPCCHCSKPLRTPKAKHCAECGSPRSG